MQDVTIFENYKFQKSKPVSIGLSIVDVSLPRKQKVQYDGLTCHLWQSRHWPNENLQAVGSMMTFFMRTTRPKIKVNS